MARSLTTTDHDTIRKWAEERGGKPSEVASTARGDDVGIIRIDFPGFSGEGKLQEISWDDWFKKFDESSLALVYEEETADGQRSNFNKLVGRETAEKRAEGVKTNRRSLRAGGGKQSKARAASPRGSRQATRAEAARTTRAKRTSRGASAASRGSASPRKATSARKRSTSVAATSGRSTSGRSASGRSSGGSARKGARGGTARKSR